MFVNNSLAARQGPFPTISESIFTSLRVSGILSAAIPGEILGMDYAHRKYGSGKISWSTLVEPARKLAASGFPISKLVATYLKVRHREDSGQSNPPFEFSF